MKKFIKKILVIGIFLFNTMAVSVSAVNMEDNQLYNITAKRDLLVLMLAYKDEINTIEQDSNGLIYLVMNSGNKVLYDDKKPKSDEEKLSNPDVQDMLEVRYPLDEIEKVQKGNKDPGRARVYTLLNEVYGSSEGSITKNLVQTSTNYGTFPFNKKADASENLKKALNEAFEASKSNPKIGGFVAPVNGTFNYRVVRGTGRLSAHAYGIAIDLNRHNSDYWKWVSEEQGSKRIASYPKELVKAFENNGFVWGGKWEHFDILHFEYRPEFILKAKYFSKDEIVENGNWYDGIEITEDIKNKIDIIDKTIH